MLDNTISENKNIFNQIVAQFFVLQNVNDFEKSHYVLEYSGQDRISVTCENEQEINRFIEGFFCTCVTQMKLFVKDDTLIVPCIFRFLDSTINSKSSTTSKPVEITIQSPKANSLYQKYFIPRT